MIRNLENVQKHNETLDVIPFQNRTEILTAVHEFYNDSKVVKDPEELQERIKMAKMVLANFKMYHAKVIELRRGHKTEKVYDHPDINTPGKDFIYVFIIKNIHISIIPLIYH